MRDGDRSTGQGGPTGRERLAATFAATRAEGRAALFPYLTAGLPDPETSVALFEAMAAAGADGFEVGIPYADPLMDGPVIMEAGERALDSGVTVDVALDVVRAVTLRTGKPVLVMTYVNPILRMGIDDFCRAAAEARAAGLIVADLPVDEMAPFREAALAHGLGIVVFAAPTTGEDRLAMVAEADPAFVYAIAEVGVTGERAEASRNTAKLAEALRRVTDAPIVFGVGISTPEQVAHAATDGDGVIVGTAIVRRVLEATTREEAIDSLSRAVASYASATRRRSV